MVGNLRNIGPFGDAFLLKFLMLFLTSFSRPCTFFTRSNLHENTNKGLTRTQLATNLAEAAD